MDRIVINFDDEDDDAAPEAAPPGRPADLLRSIQSMRLSFKRLQQEKAAAQHGGVPANLPANLPASAMPRGGVVDKQASLLAEVGRVAHWSGTCPERTSLPCLVPAGGGGRRQAAPRNLPLPPMLPTADGAPAPGH